MWDVIIVGAGPAGLSAALILGRCLRRVLVCDSGRPRNAASHELHGFLSRDAIAPSELLKISRAQLARYTTVELLSATITRACRVDDHFELTMDDDGRLRARKLLLATGVVDELPDIAGIAPLYGLSVFHCPYCDGWETREQAVAAYGQGKNGLGLALQLTRWTRDLVLCTNGPSRLSRRDIARLERFNIPVRRERIARLEGSNGRLDQIVFENGGVLPRRALFFTTGQQQGCNLAEQLGCQMTTKGAVRTGKHEATEIPGLYVAGDATRLPQLAIIAAAEGAQAAFAINSALLSEDLAT